MSFSLQKEEENNKGKRWTSYWPNKGRNGDQLLTLAHIYIYIYIYIYAVACVYRYTHIYVCLLTYSAPTFYCLANCWAGSRDFEPQLKEKGLSRVWGLDGQLQPWDLGLNSLAGLGLHTPSTGWMGFGGSMHNSGLGSKFGIQIQV